MAGKQPRQQPREPAVPPRLVDPSAATPPTARRKKTPLRRAPGRPLAADSATTRAAILDGARSCFAQGGYGVTTLMDIADKAGVTPGTIYHYFDSKPALFVAVGDYVGRTFFDEFVREAADATHIRDRMTALVRTFLRLTTDDPTVTAFMAVWAVEVSQHEEIRSIVGGDGLASPVDYYRHLGKDALEAGQLATNVDDDMIAGVCVSALFGLAMLVQVGYEAQLTTAACDGLMHLFAGDLVEPAGAPTPSGRRPSRKGSPASESPTRSRRG